MRYELRESSVELMQLALWLQMLSRGDAPTRDQIDLILVQVEAGLRKVKLLKTLGGDGETPGL